MNSGFSVRWFLTGLLLISLLVGCATSPPVQEMSDARQAIAVAEEAGAETHARDHLSAARILLERAEAQLATGTSNGYWQARNSAVGAKEVAFEALLKSRAATTSIIETPAPASP